MTGKQTYSKVIISGGGTGGHIYPAIAIADALQKKGVADLLFVGANGRMEMEKVPQAGYQIVGLPISGLQRRLTLSNLLVPFKLLLSLWKAFRLVKSFRPGAVVGVGGYASGPTVYMASLLGVPALLQEQNGYAGLTNKLLAKRVKTICVAYPGMEKYFPAGKIKLTGNPVRKDIGLAHQTEEAFRLAALEHFGLSPGQPVLLVIGGSLGAKTINECLLAGHSSLAGKGIQLLWQTGKYYHQKVMETLGQLAPGVSVNAFIQRMDLAYACADVVISRAGALSISELCLAARPVILVPSPNVAEDHQTKNAKALVAQNAAILVTDQAAREELLPSAIALMEDEKQKAVLSQNIKKLAKPEAANEIADEIIRLMQLNDN